MLRTPIDTNRLTAAVDACIGTACHRVGNRTRRLHATRLRALGRSLRLAVVVRLAVGCAGRNRHRIATRLLARGARLGLALADSDSDRGGSGRAKRLALLVDTDEAVARVVRAAVVPVIPARVLLIANRRGAAQQHRTQNQNNRLHTLYLAPLLQ